MDGRYVFRFLLRYFRVADLKVTTMSINKYLPIMLLGTALMVSACNNNPGNANSQTPSAEAPNTSTSVDTPAQVPLPKACTLVTANEAQAVLDIDMGLMSDEAENCIWAGGDNPGKITLFMVQLVSSDSVAEAQTMFDSIIGITDNVNSAVNDQLGSKARKSGQEIEGLGNAAWCSASTADLIGTQKLVILDGTIVLAFNITGMRKGERQASLCPRLEAAGRTALARLGGAK